MELRRILVNFLAADTTAQKVATITNMTATVLNSGIVGLGADEGAAVGATVGDDVGALTVIDVAVEFTAVPLLSVT